MGPDELSTTGEEAAYPAKVVCEQGWALQGWNVVSEIDKPAEPSFLTRWSRRKVDAAAQDAAAVTPAMQSAPLPDVHALPNTSTGAVPGAEMAGNPLPEPTLLAEPEAKAALPSIESLTHDVDFSPFMARDVDPGLRNQAMKKLFTNPHYQFAQMDKLDIYIDDYSQPDPIPLEMLRQMNQAKALFLFEDEEKDSPPQVDTPTAGLVDAAPVVADPARAGAAEAGADEKSDAENSPQ